VTSASAVARINGGYVDTRWGQVHFRTCGTEGPWVALFHESPLSARAFDAVLGPIGASCRVVAFDTPGYGASDPPPSDGFDIPDYARTLGEAMVGLRMTRPVLCGVHTGASIAVEAALFAPGGAAGLVLSGVPLFTAAERTAYLADWTPPVPIDADGSQFGWAVQRYQRIYGPAVPPEMLDVAVVELLRVAPRYDWAYRAAFRHDPGPSLHEFDGPVLLLDAEHDLLADKDPIAMATARNARLVVVPGISGQPHLRTPQRYAAEVTAFATALDPPAAAG
jgi:pimeloyl-ACP methyl ester carboxylesterase